MARRKSAEVEQHNQARNRDRTDDLILTKDVLYRLSYASMTGAGAALDKSVKVSEPWVGLKGPCVAISPSPRPVESGEHDALRQAAVGFARRSDAAP